MPAVNGYRRIRTAGWLSLRSSPELSAWDVDTPDDDLTDDHMRLLEWLATHPTESLASAAQALGLALTDVEWLCADLVDAGIIERASMQ